MGKWSFMELLKTQGAGQDDYQEIYLSPYEVVPSESNFYSQENIEELAESILAVGQQQPTVIACVDGVYKIVSGHRRNLANIYNIERGALPEDYQVRYLCKDMSGAMFELSLLMGNAYNRVLTPYEEMEQAARLKAALLRAREEDGLEIKGKLRDIVADIMHTSPSKVARMNKTNNSLITEAKEQFKAGRLGKSAAYETSRLPEEQQKEIAESVAKGQDIGHKNIAERVIEQREEMAGKRESDMHVSSEETGTDGGITTSCAMNEHELKIYPQYFHDVASKRKTFEVRKNDRRFLIGDMLVLKEWDNIRYTGRETTVKVVYVMDDAFVGVAPGYVILGIEPVAN